MLPLALMLTLAAEPIRVYVAPIVAANVDAATVSLIQDRVLVATRKHTAGFEVVSSDDVRAVLDAEALRAAVNCDTTGCAAEIADALSAPQLITGQLGHIGSTWQLTLTRVDRNTLQAVARATRDARGETPEELLPLVPGLVDEVLGVAPAETSVLSIVGWTGAGTGAAVLLVGAGLYAFSWGSYFDADAALKRDDVPAAQAARDVGEAVLVPAFVVGGAGIIVGVVGATLIFVDSAGGAE